MCPEFNSRVRRIDVFKCQSDENGCPNAIFWSNAVYIYPICYEKTLPTTTNNTDPTIKLLSMFLTSTIPQMSGNTTFDENKNQEKVIIIVISAIATVFLIAILSSVAVYLVRKTHRRSNTGYRYNTNSSDRPIQLAERKENNEGDALIGNLPMNLIKEIYGVHVLILVNGRKTDLDENFIKEAAMKEIKIAVDMENSFQKWEQHKKRNKTEGSYVFRDWITSDGEYNEDDLRRTQLEIIHAIKKKETKFVFVFPLTVWSQNTIINNMEKWNICRKKTITEHSAI